MGGDTIIEWGSCWLGVYKPTAKQCPIIEGPNDPKFDIHYKFPPSSLQRQFYYSLQEALKLISTEAFLSTDFIISLLTISFKEFYFLRFN